MAINLLDITPHQVSKDLRGYSVFFYGEPKAGKTTIATKFPNHLLLAFEKGYNALPGVMAQPINSWTEFRQVLKQLEKEEVKAKYETIIVDTADIAYDYCSKYVCANAPRSKEDGGGYGYDTIGDIPYGKGYGMVGNEFDTHLRKIVMMGYGLVIISHSTDKTFKDERGQEYLKIVPTLDKRANNIVARMCDIIGYARPVQEGEVTKTYLFMRGTARFEAGSRFKHTPDYIEFNYRNLVDCIAKAIEEDEKENGSEYFTENRETAQRDTTTVVDFDDEFNKFNQKISYIMEKVGEDKFGETFAGKVTQIVERYLGKGSKVANCNRDQVEALVLINDDLNDLIKNEVGE